MEITHVKHPKYIITMRPRDHFFVIELDLTLKLTVNNAKLCNEAYCQIYAVSED